MNQNKQPEALLIAKWLRESPSEAVSWADSAAMHIERLYSRVQALEAAQAQRVPLLLPEILHFAGEQGFVRVQGTRAFHAFIDGTDIAGKLEAMARDIERAHGIGVDASQPNGEV